MARYKENHRETLQLFTGSLDLLLPSDSLARDIWSGLARLDFSIFDGGYKNDGAGRPAIDPRYLVAVWMLGIMRGVTSSVRLSALCAQDVEFRWLLGDGGVEKSTLCDFRKRYTDALASLSAQVLGALGQHGLLPGENMGVDGTIVRAASSRHSVKSRRRLERHRTHLETMLREKFAQVDGEQSSAELKAAFQRRERLEEALEEMTSLGLMNQTDRITVTEPDAPLRRQKNGSFAPGHNVQVVTDLDTGVIVHSEVVDSANDSGQLQPMVAQAQAVLKELAIEGEGIQSVTADSAYHDTLQLDALEKQGVRCYVPEDRNANRMAPDISPEYQSNAFVYDERTDTMRCPQGEDLKRRKLNNNKVSAVYQAPKRACQNCTAKSQCCPKTEGGRSVNRTLYPELLHTVSERLNTPEGQSKKRARWVVSEGAFARLNGLLHWGRCRMWGKAGAEAELLWRQLTHNLMLLLGRWKPMIPEGHKA